MDTETNGNDTGYVSFGKRETQILGLETATELLTLWCDRHPEVFGMYLAEVLTGARPKGTKGQT